MVMAAELRTDGSLEIGFDTISAVANMQILSSILYEGHNIHRNMRKYLFECDIKSAEIIRNCIPHGFPYVHGFIARSVKNLMKTKNNVAI